MKITSSSIFTFIAILLAAGLIGQYIYKMPRYSGGEKAPAIEATLENGERFSLEAHLGKFVLVDFWGSWCGPCRRENPQLVKLYRTYHNKQLSPKGGLEIVSIGVENNEKRWKRAIAKDGLDWPYHIIDKSTSLRFFNGEIAKSYGIKEVPTKYLINPDGEIMEANPSVERIMEILNSQLN